jgi:hypothetical protein
MDSDSIEKGFIVRALTNTGTIALDQCIQEEKVVLSKMSLFDKIRFQKMWIRKTTRDPLTDYWKQDPSSYRFVKIDMTEISSVVVTAMTENGAKLDVDFSLEVFQ